MEKSTKCQQWRFVGICLPLLLSISSPVYAQRSACITTAINLPNNHRQLPDRTPPIPQFQHLMFLAKEVTDYLDTTCPSDPEYKPARAEFQAIYDNAKKACTDMASSPSICGPKQYGQ